MEIVHIKSFEDLRDLFIRCKAEKCKFEDNNLKIVFGSDIDVHNFFVDLCIDVVNYLLGYEVEVSLEFELKQHIGPTTITRENLISKGMGRVIGLLENEVPIKCVYTKPDGEKVFIDGYNFARRRKMFTNVMKEELDREEYLRFIDSINPDEYVKTVEIRSKISLDSFCPYQ